MKLNVVARRGGERTFERSGDETCWKELAENVVILVTW